MTKSDFTPGIAGVAAENGEGGQPHKVIFPTSVRALLLSLSAEDALRSGIDSSTEVYLMEYVDSLTTERVILPCFARPTPTS